MISEILFELINFASSEHPITAESLIERLANKHNISTCDPTLRKTIKTIPVNEHIVGCREGFFIAKTQEDFDRGIAWNKYRIAPIVENVRMLEAERDRVFGNQFTMEL